MCPGLKNLLLVIAFGSALLSAKPPARRLISPSQAFELGISRTRFAYFSDTHFKADDLRETPALGSDSDVHFAIFGGDAIHRQAGAAGWNRFWEFADLLFPNKPLLFIPGNHDLFEDGEQEWERQLGYSAKSAPFAVNAGPVRIAAVNSNLDSREEWESTAAAIEAIFRDTGQWKVLALHHPFFSFKESRFGRPRGQRGYILDQLLGKLRALKVDLVLSGDAHMFQYVHRSCIDFLVAGTIGGNTYPDPEKLWFYAGTQIATSEPTVTFIEATDQHLNVETRRVDGTPLHQFARSRKSPRR